MKEIKIKAIDLVSVAVAAELWFKRNNEIANGFEKELKAATNLKNELYRIMWDEDAKLTITEE